MGGDSTPVTMILKGPLGEKDLNCNGFDKNFSLSPSLLSHRGLPTEERAHPYNTCKSFQCNGNLTSQDALPMVETPFRCTGCGKTFRGNLNLVDLVQHQIANTGEKSFMCTECEKSFNQNSVLKEHCQSYINVNAYHCSLTDARHQVHHSSELYVCNECGKTFRQNSSLRKHQKSHMSEKPYECNECGKAIRWSSNLIQHQRIHSEEKSYICDRCGKAFRHSSNLIKHHRICRIHSNACMTTCLQDGGC